MEVTTNDIAAVGEEQGETFDIAAIMALLPHRYPFLLVDRVERVVRDESGIGIKNVTINEPFFQGHFPARPVMPGVLLLEGMAQTAGVICAQFMRNDTAPKSVFFLTVDKAKFRRPVGPGDRIEYHMTKLNRRKLMWWFRGEARVGGALACEAELGAMIGEQ
jgi:3-hydroxyacyl-[acyl-carrier-protein] dehydratase